MEDKELNKIFSKNLNYWLARRGKTQADLYKKMDGILLIICRKII